MTESVCQFDTRSDLCVAVSPDWSYSPSIVVCNKKFASRVIRETSPMTARMSPAFQGWPFLQALSSFCTNRARSQPEYSSRKQRASTSAKITTNQHLDRLCGVWHSSGNHCHHHSHSCTFWRVPFFLLHICALVSCRAQVSLSLNRPIILTTPIPTNILFSLSSILRVHQKSVRCRHSDHCVRQAKPSSGLVTWIHVCIILCVLSSTARVPVRYVLSFQPHYDYRCQ